MKKTALLLLAGLLASFSAFCWLGPKDDSIYGPFTCDACRLTSPMPEEPEGSLFVSNHDSSGL